MSSRAEMLRLSNANVERLARVREQLQQRFTLEKFEALMGKMDMLVSKERDGRKQGDLALRLELQEEAAGAHASLREEVTINHQPINLRSK